MQCAVVLPVPIHQRWMCKRMADSPAELQTEPSTDSFQNLLQHAWPDLPDAIKQEASIDSPKHKQVAAARESQSDTDIRRDSATAGSGPAIAAEAELGSGSASAHGADSGMQHSSDGPRAGRGSKGRGRKSGHREGHETAQQRAHRRFYERKKTMVRRWTVN